MKSVKEHFIYAISILVAAAIAVGWDIIQQSSVLAQSVYIISWVLLILALLKLWYDIYIRKDPLVIGHTILSRRSIMIMLLAIAIVATAGKSHVRTEFCYQYLNNIALVSFMSFVVGIFSLLPFRNNNLKQ